MAFNITNITNYDTGIITDACFDWCKAQHIANNFEPLNLVVVAMVASGLAYGSVFLDDWIVEQGLGQKYIDVSRSLLNLLAFLLLAGYLLLVIRQ